MNNDNKWDIERVPSKKEKVLGIVLSAVILIFFSLVLFVSGSIYLDEEYPVKSLTSVFVSLVLFFGSLILFIRIAFGKGEKPTKKAIRNTGYVLFSMSCAMIASSFFVGLSTQTFYMIGIGIVGISGSQILLSRGAVRDKS